MIELDNVSDELFDFLEILVNWKTNQFSHK